MSIRRLLVVAALTLAPGAVLADGPGLGQPVTEADLVLWDISIAPDGRGLPSGSGTSAEGAAIFATKCAGCHGAEAKGGANAALVGGQGTLAGPGEANKTVGSYWPYATTVFDYIRRAMPWPQPKTLSNDEVYAVTAYILKLNGIIGENDTMNAEALPRVKMPNRDGFISRYPEKH